MDADEFLDILGSRIYKRKKADVVLRVVREAVAELLTWSPQIIMREEVGKRPFEALVIEITGPVGALTIHFCGHSIEFRA